VEIIQAAGFSQRYREACKSGHRDCQGECEEEAAVRGGDELHSFFISIATWL